MDRQQLVPIVEKAMQGNKAALQELIDGMAMQVVYMCTKLLGQKQDGEDAAQQVLLKLYQNIHRLREAESFIAWLNRMVHTTCNNYRRDNARFVHPEAMEDGLLEVQEHNIEFLPQEFAESSEKRHAVLKALDTLPPHYKQVLLMHYFENMTGDEIAHALNIPTKLVYSYMFRARQKLREELEDKGMQLHSTAPLVGIPVLTRILQTDAALMVSEEAARAIAAAVVSAGGIAGMALGKKLLALIIAAGVGMAAIAYSFAPLSNGSMPVEDAAPAAQSPESMAPSHTNGASSTLTGVLYTSSGSGALPAADTSTYHLVPQPGEQAETSGGGSSTPETRTSTAQSSQTGNAGAGSSTNAESEAGGQATSQEGVNSSSVQEDVSTPVAISSRPWVSSSQTESSAISTSQPGNNGGSETGGQDAGETLQLAGSVVFVNQNGVAVANAGAYTSGFTLRLWQGGTLLAQANTANGGAYSFTVGGYLPANGALTLEAEKPEGSMLVFPAFEGNALVEVDAHSGSLPALHVTDNTPPEGSIQLTGGISTAPGGEFIHPQSAALQYFDHTACTLGWQVLNMQGAQQASGRGTKIALANLGLATSYDGEWYTLRYTITDMAGNETVLEREFILFA